MESLPVAYLNRVLEQMLAYGDRVQFALTGGGQGPRYQVINTANKKMTFDSDHLLTANTDAFVGSSTTSPIYTLEQIESAMAGTGGKTAATGSARGGSGTGGGRTTAAQKLALVDAEKYEYFKKNRSTLPADIGKHAQEISALMMNGMSAEDAFAEVIKRHH